VRTVLIATMAALASAALIPGHASANVGCDGNACSEVSVDWDGSKWVASNHGSKAVNVSFETVWGGVTFTLPLNPGEAKSPGFTPGQLQSFKVPYHANYK
jgi:hypothetical protein